MRHRRQPACVTHHSSAEAKEENRHPGSNTAVTVMMWTREGSPLRGTPRGAKPSVDVAVWVGDVASEGSAEGELDSGGRFAVDSDAMGAVAPRHIKGPLTRERGQESPHTKGIGGKTSATTASVWSQTRRTAPIQ